MKTLLKPILIILISFITNSLSAQCLCNEDDCGSIFAKMLIENDKNVVCDGAKFSVENKTDVDADLYVWDWGDGAVDTLYDKRDAQHTYSIPDSVVCLDDKSVFAICLTAYITSCGDEFSCNSAQSVLSVVHRPKAKIKPTPEVCIEDNVPFVNESCNENTYLWDFGDGTTSTEKNPSHKYTNPGTYTVRLKVGNDETDCGMDETQMTVRVIGVPVAETDFSLNPTTGCAPVTITFTNQSQNVSMNSANWTITPKNWVFADTIYTETTWDNQIIIGTPDVYTIELEVENACGTDVWEEEIEIFERPTVRLSPFDTYCEEAKVDFCDFTTSTGTANETKWLITDPNGNQSTITDCGTQTYSIPGAYVVRVEVDGGSCGTVSDRDTFFLQTPDGVTFGDNPTTICSSDEPFIMNVFPPNGTWSGSSAVNRNTGLFDPNKATIGTTTLMYDPPGDCANEGEITIAVIESASLTLPKVEPQCESFTYISNARIEGATNNITWCYQLEGENPNCVTQNNPPQVLFDQGGLHLFYVTLESDCGDISDTIEIEIQTLDEIIIPELPSPICNTSSPISLNATPPGGQWTLNGTPIDTLFDPSSVPVGSTANLVYTFGEGVCESSKEISVIVEASVPIDIVEAPVVCITESEFTLDFNPKGGTWTGEGIIDSSEGIFNPQITGEGTHLLSYTFEDDKGCSIIKETNIEVEALPEVTEQQKEAAFCETMDNIQLNEAINLNFTPTTGTISWSGVGVINEKDGVFNSFQAGGTGKGMYQLVWKYELEDCFITDTLTVIVDEKQTAFAGEDTTVCITDGTLQLVGTPVGGKWNGPQINIEGTIDLEVAGDGVKTYEYIFSEGTTCEVKDEVKIDIKDLSGVKAGSDFAKCEASEPFQLTNFSPAGGVWTSTNAPVTESGRVDPSNLAAGEEYQLMYCISEEGITCTACAEITMTIDALPTALFEIDGTTCVGETLDLNNLSENGVRYEWDFDNGQTSRDETPAHAYNQIGNYNMKLTVTSNEGCTDEYTIPISVTEPPRVGFVKDKTEGCAVLEVNFTNQSSGTDVSYLWDFGNGDSLTVENPETIAFEQGNADKTYHITLAATNGCGTLIQQDSVTVFPLPITNFGTDVDEGCSPLEIEVSNITLGNPDTYEWYIEGEFFSTDSMIGNQIFTTSDSAITVYPITLIAENECGIDTLTKEITVFPPNVDAFLSIDTTKGCQPLEVQFSNFSTPGATITWDFGDGNGSNEANTSHIYEEAGIYTIRQFAANCGIDSDSIRIEVLPAPEVNFESDPYACIGQGIDFVNNGVNISGSSWDFSTGDTSVVTNPTYIFDSMGTYTVTLTGFSTINSCPTTFQKEIEVYGKPAIGFEPNILNGCPPLNIIFTNTSSTGLTYEWDFQDGIGETAASPTHTFTESGTYPVSLKGTDNFGCFSDSSILNIIVHDVPESEFTTDGVDYCSRIDTVFIQNQSRGADQYLWLFGGADTSKIEEPYFLIPDPKNYSISLTTTNQFGCRDTQTQNITSKPSPLANLPERTFKGCSNLKVQFTNISEFSDNYIWDFGDGNTSTEGSPNHVFQEPATYEATLIALNTNGCPSDTLQTEITVNEVPQSNFELSENFVCGLPTLIEGTNTSTGGIDFTWNFGNGQVSKDKDANVTYEQPNDYRVSLITANQFGCADTSYQQISANLQPIAELEPKFEQNCEEDIITFLNFSTGANGWQWDFGDGNTSTEQQPEHPYEKAGSYDVQLIADYNGVCFDSIMMQNVLTIFQAPVADFTWMDREKGYIQLVNLSQNGATYAWDFGDNAQSTEFEPLHEYEDNGAYTIELMTIHQNGCRKIHTDTIRPNFFGNVFFPNAFSPLVGVDEVRLFKPKGKGLATFHLQIFTAWGELVYESKAIDGEEPAAAWDGFYKGEVLPQGAYAWKASWELLNGKKQTATGSVILLR